MELHLSTLKELGRPLPEASSSAVSWASETFADAIRESYEALADRSVSAQELDAQLTQDFTAEARTSYSYSSTHSGE